MGDMKLTIKITLFIWISLCFTQTVHASIADPLPLEELSQIAEHIVLARVRSKEAYWDDQGRIATRVELIVEEKIKGFTEEGDLIAMHQLGGEIGKMGMKVIGEASLREGDRAFFFLEKGFQDELHSVALSQGVFPIEGNKVLPNGEGLSFTSLHSSSNPISIRRKLSTKPLSVERFIRTLRLIVVE
jgi:hypothetical protein